MDEKTQKNQNEYDEPSLLDVEDLEKVSGGGCGTGGTIILKQPTDAE